MLGHDAGIYHWSKLFKHHCSTKTAFHSLSSPYVRSGKQDSKYVEVARQMAAVLGANGEAAQSSRFVEVNAGHAVHIENPSESLQAICSFLDDGK